MPNSVPSSSEIVDDGGTEHDVIAALRCIFVMAALRYIFVMARVA